MRENFVSYSGKKAFAIIALLTVFVVGVPAQLSDAAPLVRAREFAFYGTNNADWVVLTIPTVDPNPFVWKVLKNPSSPLPGQAQIKIFNWGVNADIVTPGSWTGDATYDAGVFRPGSVSQYWVVPTEAPSTALITKWGMTGDNLGREGDYDGDGIMDPTVIRITGGLLGWWIRLSTTGQLRVVNFGTTLTGTSLFAFRGADFTGDGRDEFTLARVVNATGATTWYVGDAVTGAQLYQIQWGNFNTHFIINPADYTGDGRADLVTWAAGEQPANQHWWILNVFTNTRLPLVRFGIGDPAFINYDFPIRGDYDGDGIHDICVWRPNNATFYCQRSTDGALVIQQWGLTTDVPLGTFFTF
jgi:hypothetical protein